MADMVWRNKHHKHQNNHRARNLKEALNRHLHQNNNHMTWQAATYREKCHVVA